MIPTFPIFIDAEAAASSMRACSIVEMIEQAEQAACHGQIGASTRFPPLWADLAPTYPKLIGVIEVGPELVSHVQLSEVDPTLADEIRAYTRLPLGWDGFDGQPANQAAANDAIAFLQRLPGFVPTPSSMVSASGEVALYWVHGETYAEVGFDGSGSFYAFAEAPFVQPVHIDDQPLASGFPSELRPFVLAPLAAAA